MLRPVLLATLLAAPLSAQSPTCLRGVGDTTSARITIDLAHPVQRIAPEVDSTLAILRYTLPADSAGPRHWAPADRLSWGPGDLVEKWHDSQHPGERTRVILHARGDSTTVEITSRTLCRDGSAEFFEGVAASSVSLVLGHRLMAAGLVAWGGKPFAVTGPPTAGGYEQGDRRDYEDPRLGSSLRYNRQGGGYLDLYIYPGLPDNPACPALCAWAFLNREVEGFLGEAPELVRRGYYERIRPTADETLRPEPGARWQVGRHVTLDAIRDGVQTESHFYLFAFPGFMVKVRATFPPSPQEAGRVQEFVREVLPKLTPQQQ